MNCDNNLICLYWYGIFCGKNNIKEILTYAVIKGRHGKYERSVCILYHVLNCTCSWMNYLLYVGYVRVDVGDATC